MRTILNCIYKFIVYIYKVSIYGDFIAAPWNIICLGTMIHSNKQLCVNKFNTKSF